MGHYVWLEAYLYNEKSIYFTLSPITVILEKNMYMVYSKVKEKWVFLGKCHKTDAQKKKLMIYKYTIREEKGCRRYFENISALF